MSKLISSEDNENSRSLHAAINEGDLEAALRMLGEGASKDEVNEVNSSGQSPLYAAADKGWLEIVQCLVTQGADKEKVDVNGWTPLFIAAW
jgi:ankyrin repeat protein